MWNAENTEWMFSAAKRLQAEPLYREAVTELSLSTAKRSQNSAQEPVGFEGGTER
jgi:hypothetical protein